MAKLRIAIDLDSIIIDLLRPWLSWYNHHYEDTLTIDDVIHYDMHELVHPRCGKSIYKFFDHVDNYEICPVLPGATEGLKELYEEGHDIVIATAVAGNTESIKKRLVKKAAPFLPTKNIMIGSRKEWLAAHIFIDDSPKNVLEYKKTWPAAKTMAIAYPYNKSLASIVDVYAADHHNTKIAWKTMVEAIHKYALYHTDMSYKDTHYV